MHLMGVATCAVPMNTQQDAIYTHKKFKKAASDAVDDGKRVHQQQPPYEGITNTSSSSNTSSDSQTLLLKTTLSDSITRGDTYSRASSGTSYNAEYTATAGSRTSNSNYNAASTTTAAVSWTSNNYNTVSKVTSVSPLPLTSKIQVVPHALLVPVNGHTGSDSDEGKRNLGGKYKCEYCGVGCAKPSVLEKHRRTHTNERPFSCDQCRLAFKTKSNYLKHTKSRAHALRNDSARNDSGKNVLDYLEVEWDEDDDDSDGGNKAESFMQKDHNNDQPADLSVSATDFRADHISNTKGDDAGQDRSKTIYKPKIHGHYIPSEEQSNIKISSHLPPGYTVQDASHLERNPEEFSVFPPGSVSRTVSPHNSVYVHSRLRSHSPGIANNHSGHQQVDVPASGKHEDFSSSIQRNTGSPMGTSLWKGIKSPSPEQLGQHIEKIISVNQAIVETHNPLWSRRYRRQNSIGSSSNDGEGSGGNRNRRSSLTETQIKGPKGVPSLGGTSNFQPHRERNYGSGPNHHPLSVGESIMGQGEVGSSFSPGSSSLPQSPHMLGPGQAQNALISCSTSKPSISLHGPPPPHSTSYSQSLSHHPLSVTNPQSQTNYSALINHSLRRSLSEGPSMDVREILKLRGGMPLDDSLLARAHPQNPEGSVIKNILLANRQSQNLSGIIENSLPYEILEKHAGKSSENGPYICSRCGLGFRNVESRGIHMRHICGQSMRSVATPPDRRTPDSLKSSNDNGRWLCEQDVALDLQKKMDTRVEQERSLSRGSSVGEPPLLRSHGSEPEEFRPYRMDHSPRLYRSDSLPESASSPPTKRRKLSEIDIHGAESSHVFRSPSFSPKGRFFGKHDLSNSKLNNHQMFGGEVQIKEGTELKTMRIDPSKHPGPTMDIKIPPQQLGSNLNRDSDVSVPSSVVMTMAKSGLNSGGTMVQVESKDSTSTCSTKTVPSLVSSSVSHTNQSGGSLISSPATCKSGIAPANLYNLDGTHFPFSPSLLPYAPTILLPNLGIPGISAPDLGVLPMYKQTHSHGGGHSGGISKQTEREAHKSTSDHQSGTLGQPNGPTGHQRGPAGHSRGPTCHQSGLSDNPNGLSGHQRGPAGAPSGHRSGSIGHRNSPQVHQSGPTGHQSSPLPSSIGHLGIHSEHSHVSLGVRDKEALRRSPKLKGPLHLATSPVYPTVLSVGEGKLAHLKGSSSHPVTSPLYPAVLNVGEGKVPYVPGIPGPYSQAGPVRPSSGIHKNTVTNNRFSHSSISHSAVSSQSSLVHSFVTHNSIAQIRDQSSGQILSPSTPHSFSPVVAYKSSSQENKSITTRIRDPPIQVCEATAAAAARNLETHLSSLSVPNALSLKLTQKDLVFNKNRSSFPPSSPDIRIHPSESSNIDSKMFEKSIVNKNEISPVENYEGLSPENIDSELSQQRKRPDSLALKPQQYVPKSSLSLIGSTLASPDTPRPKKSCVQQVLNGSAYTYLGHKVSTKSFFCCIHRPQPMCAPQSTDPKLSMYSKWQNRKPAEANPFNLTPFQSLGLYKSRVPCNRSFTVAQKKDQGLITTHSSYWEFKEKIEKKKSKDIKDEKESDSTNNNEMSSLKIEPDKVNTGKIEDIPFIKRELEESLSERGEDSETSESSSSKRVKIFEGGFKSNEDYTYVRGRGRGRYVCEACGIRCKKPSMLKKHIRTHTDLRPYTCSHCTFGFKTKGNLTKHLRSKAHYKRCVEIGITPVPTVVDVSHVNEFVLAALQDMQGKMDPGDMDGKNEDDDDDEDDEDEDMDEDDEDDDVDEQLENTYPHDPHGDRFPTNYKSGSPSSVNGGALGGPSGGSGNSIFNGGSDGPRLGSGSVYSGVSGSNIRAGLSCGVGSSSCVPHILPITVNTAASPTVAVPGEGRALTTAAAATETQASPSSSRPCGSQPSESDNISDLSKSEKEPKRSDSLGDAPIDLSVKRQSVLNLKFSTDKNKKPTGPARPNFLSLKRSGLNDMRSPGSMLTSPGTPTTPIREHPADILSPVTESSTLLKSIYSTTSRISHGPYGEKNVTPELCGDSNPMLKTYITERAVLDTTIKMQQYRNSSSDNSPDSPKNVVSENNALGKSNGTSNTSSTSFSNVNSQQKNPQIIFTKNSKEKNTEVFIQNNKVVQQGKKTIEIISNPTKQQELQQKQKPQQPQPQPQLQLQQQQQQQPLPPPPPKQQQPKQQQQKPQEEYKQQSKQQQQNNLFQVHLDESKQSVREQILSQKNKQLKNQQPQQQEQLQQQEQQQQTKQQQQRQQLEHINQIKQEASQQISQMNIALESNSSPNITVGNMNQAGAWMNAAAAAAAQPANFTVMNNGGIDIKTPFLMPSGHVGPGHTQPRLSHEDTKPKCTICKKEFNRPSQLNLHMNIHYLERPYRCDACAVSFRTNGHLQKHKRSASHFSKVNMNMTFGTPSTENPRPFKCHDCKIAFRIHGHLAKHLRSKMHIMKLECLGKLPFGTYAEIERSGANLNEIDTTDCDNSLESLLVMATRLYEKDPNKLMAWHNDQELQQQQRVRTISNSSTNSEDYPLVDDQDDPHGCRMNDDDTEGDDDDDYEPNQMPQEALQPQQVSGGSQGQGDGSRTLQQATQASSILQGQGGSSGASQSSSNIPHISHHQLGSSRGSSTSHSALNFLHMQHQSLHGSSHTSGPHVSQQAHAEIGSLTSESVREHPCCYCEAKFPSQSQLESHSKTHCKNPSQPTTLKSS